MHDDAQESAQRHADVHERDKVDGRRPARKLDAHLVLERFGRGPKLMVKVFVVAANLTRHITMLASSRAIRPLVRGPVHGKRLRHSRRHARTL